MKSEAKKKIIKDLVIFFITAIATAALLIVGAVTDMEGFRDIFVGVSMIESIIACILVPILLGFQISGMVIGWGIIGNKIPITGVVGIGIRLLISLFLGCIIFPIVLIKDVIAYKKAED